MLNEYFANLSKYKHWYKDISVVFWMYSVVFTNFNYILTINTKFAIWNNNEDFEAIIINKLTIDCSEIFPVSLYLF